MNARDRSALLPMMLLLAGGLALAVTAAPAPAEPAPGRTVTSAPHKSAPKSVPKGATNSSNPAASASAALAPAASAPGTPAPAASTAAMQRPDMVIGIAEQNAIFKEVDEEFKKRYLFAERTVDLTNLIATAVDFNSTSFITSAAEFADTLTSYLQRVTSDKHCSVFFTGKPKSHAQVSGAAPPDSAHLRPPGFTAFNNYGVQRAEVLPGNIGYINLRNFAEPESAAAPFAAAMQMVRNTSALILDLRQNGGGDGGMVAQALRYFIGPKVHLVTIRYLRKGTTEDSYTPESVPGPRYGDRPLYVLTSRFTFSAAEECAYDLKALKRATLVGETTGGGANPNEMVPLSLGFVMSVAIGQVQNDITHGNWEGHGVEPDVTVPEDAALRAAQVLALQKSMETQSDPGLKQRLSQVLAQVQDTTADAGGHRTRRIVR